MSRLMCRKLLGIISFVFIAALANAGEPAALTGEQNAGDAIKQVKKWETDDALRRGMDNILHEMDANRESIEKERLNAKDYLRLAEFVQKNAADIVKNCKLSKDADKAFHMIVLNDLTGGSQLMRSSPKLQAKRVGALGVLQALRNYGKYFDHPGWKF